MEKECSLTSNTLITRNEEKFLVSHIGDEVVMMDISKGVYIGMNSVGSNIWNILAEALPVKDIVVSLTNIYDISPGQCETETIAYLEQMLEQDMLIIQ
ncbi:Coenzyme PQQ synthesis protein D (PqqD) [Chitinophaga sp. CF118]|uniref:PqqD family peptide modification chaperone n=1 Tax=Chitinophaga sp. CF118 TaxID=1884367 RepID=UPI0008EFCED7|nr:PqqD family peptide modification chaperone [Chitinophaga sp. CF118]SFD79744.1 Coenzyme PQQ synthesis protein D (PqqD) [Chitinophaga sp. CF118]